MTLRQITAPLVLLYCILFFNQSFFFFFFYSMYIYVAFKNSLSFLAFVSSFFPFFFISTRRTSLLRLYIRTFTSSTRARYYGPKTNCSLAIDCLFSTLRYLHITLAMEKKNRKFIYFFLFIFRKESLFSFFFF